MTLQILRLLTASLNSEENAEKVVDYIREDAAFQATAERAAVDKYSDKQVRYSVFGGSTYSGGRVYLSNAARLLKAALQWSYEVSAPTDEVLFKPLTAWHVTSNSDTAKSIVAGGFNPHDGTTGGYGPYFYADKAKADDYEAPQVGRRRRPPVVLEVTIFSNINGPADFQRGYGGGTWGNQFTGQIVCMKNPLLIFPRAAYHPSRA